jgi:hypothetical protein
MLCMHFLTFLLISVEFKLVAPLFTWSSSGQGLNEFSEIDLISQMAQKIIMREKSINKMITSFSFSCVI